MKAMNLNGRKKIMGKMLTLETRKTIQESLDKKINIKQIAKSLGIAASTIHRDIKKCEGPYNAEEAHKNTCFGYKPIDLEIIGKKFGKLTIMEYTNRIVNHRTFWKALCDCGNIIYISRKQLGDYCSPDRPFSCGCIAKESCGPNGQVPIEEAALRKYQDLLAFREIEGKCWNWTGFIQTNGVAKTSWKNKAMNVRKCMYLLMNGSTYEPNPVYATCRNRTCFNPEHIALGRPPEKNWYE